MKAKLVSENNVIKLLLCDGTIIKVADDEARAFLLSFDSEKHYNKRPPNEFFVRNMENYNAKTLVEVTDDMKLVIVDAGYWRSLFDNDYSASLITAKEYAALHNKKDGIVKRLCREGRLQGAQLKGSRWFVPKDTPYPQDGREGKRV